MSDWFSIFQTGHHSPNLQELLWSGVNLDGFWVGYSIVCTVGALFLFAYLLHHRVDHNLLSVGRMLWLSGLITGAFVPLNSACQPISAALMATAGSMIGVLMATNWCYRPGTSMQKIRAILGEMLNSHKHREFGD
jgi:hypothetical protein